MKWILIYWIVTSASYPSAATSIVEFGDEKACHAAFAEMKNAKSYDERLSGACVPESSK